MTKASRQPECLLRPKLHCQALRPRRAVTALGPDHSAQSSKKPGGRELDALAMLASTERTRLSDNASGVEVWRMISVCICTYNRSASLQRTLELFALQRAADSGQVELLIVDNNCTDDTYQIVEEFRVRLPVRRVTERRQGLAHARNRAVTEFSWRHPTVHRRRCAVGHRLACRL